MERSRFGVHVEYDVSASRSDEDTFGRLEVCFRSFWTVGETFSTLRGALKDVVHTVAARRFALETQSATPQTHGRPGLRSERAASEEAHALAREASVCAECSRSELTSSVSRHRKQNHVGCQRVG